MEDYGPWCQEEVVVMGRCSRCWCISLGDCESSVCTSTGHTVHLRLIGLCLWKSSRPKKSVTESISGSDTIGLGVAPISAIVCLRDLTFTRTRHKVHPITAFFILLRKPCSRSSRPTLHTPKPIRTSCITTTLSLIKPNQTTMRISPNALAAALVLTACSTFSLSTSLTTTTTTSSPFVAAWAPLRGFRRIGHAGRLANRKKPVISLQVLSERPSTDLSSATPPPPRSSAADINQAAGAAARERKRQEQIRQQQQQQQRSELLPPSRRGTYDDDDEEATTTTTSLPSFAKSVLTAGEASSPPPLESPESNSWVPDVRNLSIPQIHLPPRLAPGVAWEHHHKATTHFVKNHWPNHQLPNPLEMLSNNNNDQQQQLLQQPPRITIDHVSDEEEAKKLLLVSRKPEWQRLEEHKQFIETTHLRDLLQDAERCDSMFVEYDGVYLDYSRQRATMQTMALLQDLAHCQKLQERIQAMVTGEKINFTEERAVLHTALRASREEVVLLDGQNVVQEVHEVLDQIKEFAAGVRSGTIRGYTGKRLRNIVSVGIGGSYLGPEFLHEVLKTEPEGINAALGYSLRFLANVDPVDVERTCADLDPEETLIVIVSKTFTTAETMLNARIMREWLWDFMGNHPDVVKRHIVACASVSATSKVQQFGIDTNDYFFRFWDWVGGRYSVCSAAGALPISLLYGFDLFEKFLKVCLKKHTSSTEQWRFCRWCML
jgi:hypothetical protein